MRAAQMSALTGRASLIAILVMRTDSGAALCPFFAKCSSVLVVDPGSGTRVFLSNEQRTAESLCNLILRSGTHQLICGYIGEEEKRRLRSAGIDIRLGSCSYPVDELVTCFDDLPKA